ncbi:MAG: N-acetylmuramoyl-L-alanine amidase-like domain-containing protein [Candidatus Eiseniibacteriota bacterium]
MRFLLPTLLAYAAAGAACTGEPSAGSAPEWIRHAEQLAAERLTDRFVEATALFLGTPYFDGPLGEGDAGGPDPDPRFDFSRADCVTYLEQALALALATPSDEASFLAALDAIRYAGGRPDFGARNHYMFRDWAPANAWLVEDVTAAVGGERTRVVRRTIDRAKFLREHGAEPVPGRDDPGVIEERIIPGEAATQVEAAIRSGDLVFWVGRGEAIDVVHTGLAVRDTGGQLLFRHASSKAGRALDEPFAAYAARLNAEGFLVLRLREEAKPPARASD